MANKELKNIFLSASIPLAGRDAKYYETADVLAIRDAVLALAVKVLPNYRLVWGGHPSITPLINSVLSKFEIDIQTHVHLYQSKYFEKFYPEDNNKFKNVTLTNITGDVNESLLFMRETMFSSYEFSAGIFIGGMEGVEDEFKLFKSIHPKVLLLPIASTGAAAKIIFDENDFKNSELLNSYLYDNLFQKELINKI
jgi:hypothetical protein